MKTAGNPTKSSGRILHVSNRETIKELRDQILRLHGFEVDSELDPSRVPSEICRNQYDLVLIDVEADVRVAAAQELCDDIKKVAPHQHVAFVCNHRVSIESDCPDEIIRAQFDPEALIDGVKQIISHNPVRD